MMGVFAEFERAMIAERVRAGLRRAKDEGKRLGRPRIPAELEKRIQTALHERKRTGEGVRGIAKRFGVDPSTVQRIRRPFDAVAARGRERANDVRRTAVHVSSTCQIRISWERAAIALVGVDG
jgi:DNA invertase Pin-like site-specific DNA recombinase